MVANICVQSNDRYYWNFADRRVLSDLIWFNKTILAISRETNFYFYRLEFA